MEIPHGTPSAYSWHKCRCDICVEAKRDRDRAYYERNRERVKARSKAWYEANPERAREARRQYAEANRDRIREQKRAYTAEHAEENRARVKAWKAANPERAAELARRYRERNRDIIRVRHLADYYRQMAENPEKVRAKRRAWAKTQKGVLANRAARHKRRGAPYTDEAKKWIASLVDPVCFYCGRIGTEIDHMTPISRGGTGERANLVPCCRRCNSRKGNQTAEEFLARKER